MSYWESHRDLDKELKYAMRYTTSLYTGMRSLDEIEPWRRYAAVIKGIDYADVPDTQAWREKAGCMYDALLAARYGLDKEVA